MSKKKPKRKFYLALVITEVPLDHQGYDLSNSKPWPLGTYNSEMAAIEARNCMVIIK